MNYLKLLLCGFGVFMASMVTSNPVFAQDFDEGLELYQKGDYQQAALIFDKTDSPEARLFAGKSYYSLGKYVKAQTYLSPIDEDVPRDIYLEKIYTLALTQVQLKQFSNALEHLYELSQEEVKNQVVTDGMRLYEDILNFLTLEQRRVSFQSVTHPEIRFDIIRSAFGKVDFSTARILLNEYENVLAEEGSNASRLSELNDLVSDSAEYVNEFLYNNKLRAPKGLVYNIGAALPRYSPSQNEFDIAQGLYYGYVLAAEEFNQRNPGKKAYIKYKNTGVSKDSSAQAMTDLAWNYRADAVLGPLFSEAAQTMGELAELYEIPMLAPLANSDDLNTDNPYFYQANPTFSSHGRRMAQYAVQELKMDTIAVLAEKNSLGEESAYVFRDEAERLGARVSYFFVEDFESQGYEIGDYTKYFTTDKAVIDSMGYHQVDGIYAPFTGQAASTLIDLLLIDLQAMNNNRITVMGSQEWGAKEIPESRLGSRNIYFTESYYINSKSETVHKFKSNYADRFGIEANRFAMIGYDAASFLLKTLERVENPALLKNALKKEPLYEGLISNINFDGKHVNQEVKIFKISDQGVQPAIY